MSDKRKDVANKQTENSQRTALKNSIESVIDLKTSRQIKQQENQLTKVHFDIVEEHHRKQ